MTPSELKHKTADTAPYFFVAKTMKFFGDTMRNYGVRDAGDSWELYRKKPVKHGLNKSMYFDKVTFKQVSVLSV